ncbi:MAG: type II secretion system F family protein [Planctomycetota bacterium]
MRYQCRYLGPDGKAATAVLDARSEQDLHDSLRESGQLLLEATPVASTREVPEQAVARPTARPEVRDRIRLHPVRMLAFSQSMQTALESGVPVLAALEAMAEQETDHRARRVWASLGDTVQQGGSLASALRRHPRSFDEFFVSLIESGEESGSLDRAFGAIADYIEWREGIKATARHALIYPCVVLAAAYGLVLFLLSFVIPRLSGILRKVTDELPVASRMLVGISDFVATNLLLIIAATLGAIVAVALAARTDRGRRTLVTTFLRIPVIHRIVATLSQSQACRNLEVLLSAGVPLDQCLVLTGRALALEPMRRAFTRVREQILQGRSLTSALASERAMPPLALSMLRLGEDSGNLPLAFQRLSVQYEREAKGAVQKAISLLEPAVTILLGVLIGTVAAIVITTLYSALQGISR